MKKSTRYSLVKLAVLALLTALSVVLSRFLSIQTPVTKIGFSFLPIAFAGVLFGPVGGALAGGLADLIGALLFPIGAYFPGYTLTAALTGAIYGFAWYKKRSPLRVVTTVVFKQTVCSLLLNTLWITLTAKTSKGFFVYLSTRLPQFLIMTAVEIAVLLLLFAVCLPERLQKLLPET